MGKKYIIYIILIAAVCGLFLMPIKITYKIYATGKVFPVNEWMLSRSIDGRIASMTKNNELDIVSNYSGREFQSGDVFDFYMEPAVMQKNYIQKGDVLGHLCSKILQSDLVRLQGLLEVEKASLNVISTGQKPEVIEESKTNLRLAKEKYITQKKIVERNIKLQQDSLLPFQQLEVSKDALELSRIGIQIAEAQLQKLMTGDKQEELELNRQKIYSIENQINELKHRMDNFAIKAPFGGLVQQKKGGISAVEVLMDLLDTAEYIAIAPIPLREVNYLKTGAVVMLKLFNSDETLQAKVTRMDNAIQLVGGKQAIYATFRIIKKSTHPQPGIFAKATIICDEISLWDYMNRVLGDIFYK